MKTVTQALCVIWFIYVVFGFYMDYHYKIITDMIFKDLTCKQKVKYCIAWVLVTLLPMLVFYMIYRMF